jgi:hypothetical protein
MAHGGASIEAGVVSGKKAGGRADGDLLLLAVLFLGTLGDLATRNLGRAQPAAQGSGDVLAGL